MWCHNRINTFFVYIEAMSAVSDRPPKNVNSDVELHLNIWLLPFLVFTFAILYFFTGFRGWLIFFIGTVGVWLLARLWVGSLKRNLHVERKLNIAWATVGDRSEDVV